MIEESLNTVIWAYNPLNNNIRWNKYGRINYLMPEHSSEYWWRDTRNLRDLHNSLIVSSTHSWPPSNLLLTICPSIDWLSPIVMICCHSFHNYLLKVITISIPEVSKMYKLVLVDFCQQSQLFLYISNIIHLIIIPYIFYIL